MSTNNKVAAMANKAIETMPTKQAVGFLKGAATIDPDGEMSKSLRDAAKRLEAGENAQKVRIRG